MFLFPFLYSLRGSQSFFLWWNQRKYFTTKLYPLIMLSPLATMLYPYSSIFKNLLFCSKNIFLDEIKGNILLRSYTLIQRYLLLLQYYLLIFLVLDIYILLLQHYIVFCRKKYFPWWNKKKYFTTELYSLITLSPLATMLSSYFQYLRIGYLFLFIYLFIVNDKNHQVTKS